MDREQILLDAINEKDKEIERLHNIIKEVREYIEKNSNNADEYLDVFEVEELLEILEGTDNDK